ncbi:MAG: hypothetical protein HQK74_05695, partial [Desulfamplus sp.]|nr:hypothetical protein [Desulfamplus sp.]
MSVHEAPSYEELKRRLDLAESSIRAIRSGQVDAIIGEGQTLLVRLLQTEKRAAHVKNILLAVRRVHQVIIRKNDQDQLIQKVCNTLTDTLGYCSACISLLDESEKNVISTISSGFDK